MDFVATGAFGLNAKINAEEVGYELKKLGTFTPSDIVSRAKDKKSPLHKYFKWDDTKAANSFRLQQARMLVLSIKHEDDTGLSKVYESVVIDNKRVYAPMAEIAKAPELIEQVLRTALNEAVYWKTKHQKYKEFFGGVFDAIDMTEETYRRKYGEKEAGRERSAGVKARNTTNKKGGGKRDNSRRQPVAS